MADKYQKCKEGLHPLREILRCDYDGLADQVVRWCPNCGAIVVDLDCDNRVYPGRIIEMKLPELAKENNWEK